MQGISNYLHELKNTHERFLFSGVLTLTKKKHTLIVQSDNQCAYSGKQDTLVLERTYVKERNERPLVLERTYAKECCGAIYAVVQ